MRLGTCLLYEGHTLQGAHPNKPPNPSEKKPKSPSRQVACFCSAALADFYSAVDNPKPQDLVLTVHHCYMHTLGNSAAYKIIENHKGKAIVKQQVQ